MFLTKANQDRIYFLTWKYETLIHWRTGYTSLLLHQTISDVILKTHYLSQNQTHKQKKAQQKTYLWNDLFFLKHAPQKKGRAKKTKANLPTQWFLYSTALWTWSQAHLNHWEYLQMTSISFGSCPCMPLGIYGLLYALSFQ